RTGVLKNRRFSDNNWLGVERVGDGVKRNRSALGPRVEIDAGGLKQTRFVVGGGSYLSASDRRLLVGLGSDKAAERVTVVWPSGRRQEFRDLAGRKGYRLIEGKDAAEARGKGRKQPQRDFRGVTCRGGFTREQSNSISVG